MRSASLLPPALEARFEVVSTLGQGAFGVVYRARDRKLDRLVALKLLAETRDPVTLSRFEREAASLASLKHPNVVAIFAHGIEADRPYLVMEHLVGRSLDQGAAGVDRLALMLQVADALEAVHRAGLVHRDLKPANLFLTAEGRPVLIDFGLVYVPDATRVTMENLVVGTLAFLSPEVLQGANPSPEADWYAWASTLFMLFEGRGPRTVNEIHAIAAGHAPKPIELRATDTPAQVRRLLQAMLDLPAAERVRGAAAVQAFLAAETGSGSSAPRLAAAAAPAPRPPGPSSGKAWLAPAALVLVGALGLVVRGGVSRIAASLPLHPDPGADREAAARPGRLADECLRELVAAPVEADPWRAPRALSARPAVAAFQAWLAQGGTLEELEAGPRAALATAWARTPLVPSAAPAAPRPLARGFSKRLVPAGDEGVVYGGWLADVCARTEELEAGRLGLESSTRELARSRRSPPGMPDEFARFALLANTNLDAFVEALVVVPEERAACAGWLTTEAEGLRALLYGAARSVAAEPASADLAALLGHQAAERFKAVGFSGWCRVPREAYVPARMEGPAGGLLEAATLRLMAFQRSLVEKDAGVKGELLAAAEAAARRATEAPGPRGSPAAARAALGAGDLVQVLRERGDAAGARREFERFAELVLKESATEELVPMLEAVAQSYAEALPELPSGPAWTRFAAWEEKRRDKLVQGRSGRTLADAMARIRAAQASRRPE